MLTACGVLAMYSPRARRPPPSSWRRAALRAAALAAAARRSRHGLRTARGGVRAHSAGRWPGWVAGGWGVGSRQGVGGIGPRRTGSRVWQKHPIAEGDSRRSDGRCGWSHPSLNPSLTWRWLNARFWRWITRLWSHPSPSLARFCSCISEGASQRRNGSQFSSHHQRRPLLRWLR